MERDLDFADVLEDGTSYRDRAVGYLRHVVRKVRDPFPHPRTVQFTFDADHLLHAHGKFYVLEAGVSISTVRQADRFDGDGKRSRAAPSPAYIGRGADDLTADDLLGGIMVLVARSVMEA